MRYKHLAIVLVMLVMSGTAFGYTAKWTPVYHDVTMCGGTAIANSPSNIDAPLGYGVLCETLHVAVHTWKDTLTLTNAAGVYDPIIFCLDNSIGVTVGVPVAVNSNTYIDYPFADSTTVQLPGRWKSFILTAQATADTTAAHGYVVIGRAAPSTQNFHLK